jgi:hypothetical protein
LDVLSPGAKDQLRRYLSKNVAGEVDERGQQPMQQPEQEETQDQNGKADRICALLEQAGVPPEAIERVRDMLEQQGNSDGTLTLQHEENGPITTKKAFDRRKRVARDEEEYGAASPNSSAMDQPPPFSGRPRESMDPTMPPESAEAQRDAALENMSRIQSLTPGDLVYKDGTPFSGRAPNGDQYIYGARLQRPAPAMDAASTKGFFTRFPDARRIRSL